MESLKIILRKYKTIDAIIAQESTVSDDIYYPLTDVIDFQVLNTGTVAAVIFDSTPVPVNEFQIVTQPNNMSHLEREGSMRVSFASGAGVKELTLLLNVYSDSGKVQDCGF